MNISTQENKNYFKLDHMISYIQIDNENDIEKRAKSLYFNDDKIKKINEYLTDDFKIIFDNNNKSILIYNNNNIVEIFHIVH